MNITTMRAERRRARVDAAIDYFYDAPPRRLTARR